MNCRQHSVGRMPSQTLSGRTPVALLLNRTLVQGGYQQKGEERRPLRRYSVLSRVCHRALAKEWNRGLAPRVGPRRHVPPPLNEVEAHFRHAAGGLTSPVQQRKIYLTRPRSGRPPASPRPGQRFVRSQWCRPGDLMVEELRARWLRKMLHPAQEHYWCEGDFSTVITSLP
jgi:hypothetical protein